MTRAIDDAKEWLTIKEAATLLGRNVSNLYRWTKNGTLPFRINDERAVEVNKFAVLEAEERNLRVGRTYRTQELDNA
jgi:predicted site-specific integrase-resolvase